MRLHKDGKAFGSYWIIYMKEPDTEQMSWKRTIMLC